MQLPDNIPDFEIVSDAALPGGLTTRDYRHVPTSLLFRLIPGGTFRRGLSEQEEEGLRAALCASGDADSEAGLAFLESLAGLRPVTEVTTAPFLLMAEALSQAQLVALLGEGAPDELGDMEDCVSLAVAEQLVTILSARGLRLPTEAEWEHSYRAGTVEPFPWGVERPESPWAPENRFGIEGMGEFAELCADGWQTGYQGAPCDDTARNPDRRPRVSRGGAAQFWPWQDVAEWVSMLSAFRSPSSEHDGFIRIRPASSLR